MNTGVKPPRVVGMVGALIVGFNGVVGSGIFALPALLFVVAGTFSPFAILIFACLYGTIVAVAAKLSTVFRQSGGHQLYAEHAFGPAVGFQIGWFALVANMSGAAANFHVLVSYLAAIFPVFDAPAVRLATILTLILFFTAVSISGTARSIKVLAVGTFLKLVPLIVLCLFGLSQNGVPTDVTLPTFSEFESIALLLAFAFSGCDIAVAAAGEIKNPRKMLFRTMFANLALVAIFYALIQLAYVAVAPDPGVTERPIAAMGAELFGPSGSLVVSVAVIFSIATLLLNVFVAIPRIAYGMARRGMLPHVFSYVSPRFETPAAAIVGYGAIIAALSLSGGFTMLAVLLVSVEQLVNVTIIAALLVMWKRREADLRRTMGVGWAFVILTAIGYTTWLLSQLSLDDALNTGVIVLIGLVLYALSRRAGVKQDEIDLPESQTPNSSKEAAA